MAQVCPFAVLDVCVEVCMLKSENHIISVCYTLSYVALKIWPQIKS